MPHSHPGASQAGSCPSPGSRQQDPSPALSTFPQGKYEIVREAALGKLTSWGWFHIYLLSDVHSSPAQDKLIACLLIPLAPNPTWKKQSTGQHSADHPRSFTHITRADALVPPKRCKLQPLQMAGQPALWEGLGQMLSEAPLCSDSRKWRPGVQRKRCGALELRLLAWSLPKL